MSYRRLVFRQFPEFGFIALEVIFVTSEESCQIVVLFSYFLPVNFLEAFWDSIRCLMQLVVVERTTSIAN
jgi:hypothetical protein